MLTQAEGGGWQRQSFVYFLTKRLDIVLRTFLSWASLLYTSSFLWLGALILVQVWDQLQIADQIKLEYLLVPGQLGKSFHVIPVKYGGLSKYSTAGTVKTTDRYMFVCNYVQCTMYNVQNMNRVCNLLSDTYSLLCQHTPQIFFQFHTESLHCTKREIEFLENPLPYIPQYFNQLSKCLNI